MQNLRRVHEFALLDLVYVILLRTLHRFLLSQTNLLKTLQITYSLSPDFLSCFFSSFSLRSLKKNLNHRGSTRATLKAF